MDSATLRYFVIASLLFSVIALTSPRAIAQSGAYHFNNIDYPNISANTYPTGINNNGNVVGWYLGSDSNQHGFSYHGAGYSAINFPGATATEAWGVNDEGLISGSYQDSSGSHGFVDNNGVFSSFDHPSGVGVTYAAGINNRGAVVGHYSDSSRLVHGFLENNGSFFTIDYPGATATTAYGINDSGQIVGYYQNASGTHGFFYNGGGTFTSIDYPGGTPFLITTGINNAGLVSGIYVANGIFHSFLWKSSTFTDLTYPSSIQAFGINAGNQLVGNYIASGGQHGFVGTPNVPQYYTLTVAITGSGTVTSGDRLINCPGICSHSYLANAQVTLDATAGPGETFLGWAGPCSGSGTCVVVMTEPLTVNAVFTEPLQFVAVTPCRIADTRHANGEFGGPPIQGGTFRNFAIPHNQSCNIPPAAAAYSLNLTAVPHGALFFLAAWPAGQPQPLVSTMNSPDGRIKANAAIVPAGTLGAVSIYASNTTDVVIDIDGYFAPPGASTLAFYPLTPCRVADTRDPNRPAGFGKPHLFGGIERDFAVQSSQCGIPLTAAAYSLNFTVVPYPALGDELGYLEVWPVGEMPQQPVSTLNNFTGTIVANAAIVPAGNSGNGAIAVYPTNDTDLIIDINGYFAPPATGGLSLYPISPCRVIDTRRIGNGQPFSGKLTPAVDVINSGCAVPSTAEAFVLNATVLPSGTLGFLALWPDGVGMMPLASTLNAVDGWTASNMAIVPNIDGKTDAYAGGLTQLILDISSYFAP